MGYLNSAAVAAVLALAPTGGFAAPIDLASFGYEIDALVEARSAFIDYVSPFLSAGDSSPPFFADLSVSAFDVSNPATAAFAFFETGGPSTDLEGSSASAFGDGSNFVQYLFEDVTGTGSLVGLNGRSMLLEVAGDEVFDFSQQSFSASGSITITSLKEIAPIPLPAGVVLLITGLAALGGIGAARRRAA